MGSRGENWLVRGREREAVLSNMGGAGACERSAHILKDGRKSDSLGARSSNASEMYYVARKACGPASITGRNPVSWSIWKAMCLQRV